MRRDYRHNHYVPEWYQKRFFADGFHRYHYLNLSPEPVLNNGHSYLPNYLRCWGSEKCFAQEDLYTTRLGSINNTDIERFFFGKIDLSGPKAIDYFEGFEHPSASDDAVKVLLTYMSAQKLRTPKGLAWLRSFSKIQNTNLTLQLLQRLRDMFAATWAECVWQIAEVEGQTGLIISDNPVTVYNKACPPLSQECRGYNDPDIRLAASHTYFPLSQRKVLILTNLSWVRNPYQSEKKFRPNPKYFRNTIFNYGEIQTGRKLNEQEVLQINLVTKKRADKFIAAANRDWLYPEKYVDHDHWKKLGGGYLFMPEPRCVYMGGQVYIGYNNGGKDAFGEYGHKPWQDGFKDQKRFEVESASLARFKAEFAMMHGPRWRSNSFAFMRGGDHVDSPETYSRYERVAKSFREKQRR